MILWLVGWTWDSILQFKLISPQCRIYASVNRVSIASANGLSPIRRQAIIWTNAGLLSIGPLGTNFGEILIKIQNVSFTTMHVKISPVKWRPYCPGGDELNPLRWRHNDHAGVSNHQPHGCLLNRLFRRNSKKTSKLRVTGLCAGNSPGTGEFPAQMASYAENVSIWWRHHAVETHHMQWHANRENKGAGDTIWPTRDTVINHNGIHIIH